MTLQEQFDTAARGLLAQGRLSSMNGVCKYRGPDERKCAVGFLIPDEMYNPEMDYGMQLEEVLHDLRTKGLELDYCLCQNLQTIHDQVPAEIKLTQDVTSHWRKELYEIAEVFHLNTHSLE